MTAQQVAMLFVAYTAIAVTVLGWLVGRLWALLDKRLDQIDKRVDRLEDNAATASQQALRAVRH